ncbi:DNA-directed DNA polymerase [Tanacetum coccineum]
MQEVKDLSTEEKLRKSYDIKATNIILPGLSVDIYTLVNYHKIAREIYNRVKELMEGTKLTKQERESKLYDDFDKFTSEKGESIHSYYLRYDIQNGVDPLALLANTYNSPPSYNTQRSQYNPQPSELHPYQPMIPSHQQQSYEPPVVQQKSPATSTQLDYGFIVPSLLPTNDPIASLNEDMMFLRRKSQGYGVSTGKSKAIGTGVINTIRVLKANPPRVIRCYNCNGEGYIAKQCTANKRLKTTSIFKAEHVDAFDSDCDEAPMASAIFMVRLSPTGLVYGDDASTTYDSDVLFEIEMDPNTSIGRLCLGENNQGSMAEGIENKEQTEEEGERYLTPCYVGGLHAYDGEINLKYEKNLISNEFTVKLCLECKEKYREKLVKRELLVSLKGEFYFVKFIINPKEDDVEPSMILGRSFMRLTKGIADFGNGIITIHPNSIHSWTTLKKPKSLRMIGIICLIIDFGDIPKMDEAGLPPFIYKMGKSKRNKKRSLENFQLCYSDVGPSLSNRKPLTQEEATREALAIDICKRFSILKEERPVIETMAYSDKYKKILDGIVMDKIKLDGEIKKEEEEAIKHVKGEALKEKEDPEAFVIPIRMEAKIDLNVLADTGSDINVMPYRIYAKLGREEVKKVNRGITLLNHSKAEPMGVIKDVLCQVGVTTIIVKFLILDMPIDRDAPILVGRGFLYTRGSILNTRDMITSTFDGVCHQTFRAAKTSLNTKESDSDDEEDYGIQRNSFGAPMYGPKPANYLNCNDPMDRALAL